MEALDEDRLCVASLHSDTESAGGFQVCVLLVLDGHGEEFFVEVENISDRVWTTIMRDSKTKYRTFLHRHSIREIRFGGNVVTSNDTFGDHGIEAMYHDF